jgi:hypothetical protein
MWRLMWLLINWAAIAAFVYPTYWVGPVTRRALPYLFPAGTTTSTSAEGSLYLLFTLGTIVNVITAAAMVIGLVDIALIINMFVKKTQLRIAGWLYAITLLAGVGLAIYVGLLWLRHGKFF